MGVAVAGGFRQVPVPQSLPWLRFPSPLIKPDVRNYRIRLSDRLHHKAHDARPTMLVSRDNTQAVTAFA